MIDIGKLENVTTAPGGTINCRCIACAENGGDKKGNHLSILPNGKFNCVAFSGDAAHNKRIFELAGSNTTEVIQSTFQSPPDIPQSWPLEILESLQKEYSYWISRGISDETCRYFKIGTAIRGKMDKRSVIPIFSFDGARIIGFTGRTLANNPNKYKHLGRKSEWLWPCDRDEILRAKSVILVESPACCLKLWECGVKNTLCLFGTNISSKIISLLVWCNVTIYIATNNEPDNRKIGNFAAEKIRNTLLQIFDENYVIIKLPPKKDFGDMSKEEILEYKSSL